MSNWYYTVTKDITKIDLCIAHFYVELSTAQDEVKMGGRKTVEKHASELPAYTELRYGQLQEIEALLEHLNITLRRKRTEVFKKFLEGYNKQLSSRDAEKYVDGDQDVYDLTVLVNEFALVRNKYLAIMKGFETKNWMIGHITKLKVAGIDDARVE